MNRDTFIAALRRGLAGWPQSQIDDTVADYEAHFREGAGAGRSEDDVAASLGDPERLARELKAEAGFRRWEAAPNASNLTGVVIALVGLATFDILFLLPLLGFVLFVLFCWIAGTFGVAFAGLVALGYSLGLTSAGIALPVVNNVAIYTLVGIGLFAGGVGSGALLLLVGNLMARGLVHFARLHFRLLKSVNIAL